MHFINRAVQCAMLFKSFAVDSLVARGYNLWIKHIFIISNIYRQTVRRDGVYISW